MGRNRADAAPPARRGASGRPGCVRPSRRRGHPLPPQHDGQLVLAPAGIALPRLADRVRLRRRPGRTATPPGARGRFSSEERCVGIVAPLPPVEGRAGDVEVAAGLRRRSASARSPGSSAAAWPPGSAAGPRAGDRPPGAADSAGTDSSRCRSGRKRRRATGRLGHEGTSSDLANGQLTKPEDTSPRLLPSLSRTYLNEIRTPSGMHPRLCRDWDCSLPPHSADLCQSTSAGRQGRSFC